MTGISAVAPQRMALGLTIVRILVGLFTRVIAILLAMDMLGAIFFVHLKNGFFLPSGFEFAFTMLLVNLALAVGGPGAYAIESRFMGRGL